MRAASDPGYYAVSMPSEPPEGYVSSADACRVLNISDRTLRRRVQAGTIAGEYVARPQGTILYVKLPEGVTAPEAAGDAAHAVSDSVSEDAASDTADAATLPTKPPETTTRLLDTVLAQAERIAALEREAGTLGSSVDAYRREVEWLRAELERARRPWWRFWT